MYDSRYDESVRTMILLRRNQRADGIALPNMDKGSEELRPCPNQATVIPLHLHLRTIYAFPPGPEYVSQEMFFAY
jgi:hypothetical protein